MHLDVRELRDFYYRSALGRAAQRALRDQLVRCWPVSTGECVLGFGFAVPLLRPWLGASRRVIGLMPGPQGVMHWPAGDANVSVLVEETQWPLATDSAQKLVVMHGLETSERPNAVLEECARVLAPGGRAMFIVPNRRGLWARRDGTPFGSGRPYSLSQIGELLEAHGFAPQGHQAALFFPPYETRFWLRSARMVEQVGQRLSNYHAGGVLMVEATRQEPAPTRPGLRAAIRRPLSILDGVPQPGAKPA